MRRTPLAKPLNCMYLLQASEKIVIFVQTILYFIIKQGNIMQLIQWVACAGSLFFLFIVIGAILQKRLQEAYALIWILLSLAMLAISLWTRLLNLLAKLLGIQTPAFALLLLMSCGTLLLLFQLTIVLSAQAEKIRRLTEEVALLRAENKTDQE